MEHSTQGGSREKGDELEETVMLACSFSSEERMGMAYQINEGC